MLRTLIKLAIVAIVANAAVKVVPVYWNHYKFKDAVAEAAKFSSKRTEREVQERVLAIASRLEIPIELQDVRVRKDRETTYVETAYDAVLEYFPGQRYPVHFDVKVEGVPPRYGDVLP